MKKLFLVIILGVLATLPGYVSASPMGIEGNPPTTTIGSTAYCRHLMSDGTYYWKVCRNDYRVDPYVDSNLEVLPAVYYRTGAFVWVPPSEWRWRVAEVEQLDDDLVRVFVYYDRMTTGGAVGRTVLLQVDGSNFLGYVP